MIPSTIFTALNRNEKVTLTYRGKKKAFIVPCSEEESKFSALEHPAFGMWRDRDDLSDVDSYVRSLRKGRF